MLQVFEKQEVNHDWVSFLTSVGAEHGLGWHKQKIMTSRAIILYQLHLLPDMEFFALINIFIETRNTIWVLGYCLIEADKGIISA